MEQITIKIDENDLVLETGRLAKQANGAVFATYCGSTVLATVCCSESEKELDYVPLQVEYNEKYYAAGKIPGGFIKREGRPKDKEILVSRLIDRPLRPLFSKNFKREIQVVPTTISTDQINPPDMIAMVASSAAVVISDIPFDGPIGAVRIASLDGELVVNPTFQQIEDSELDIVVAGTEEAITMVEGGAKEVSEELMIKAIEKARGIISEICKAQKRLRELAGKEKIEIPEREEEIELADKIRKTAYPRLEEACFVKGKKNRQDAIKAIKDEIKEQFEEELSEEQIKIVDNLFEEMEYEIVRKSILEKKVRTDGRGPEDIRSISCEIDVLPRTHGSSLFTRGETQSLAVTTLGTVFDEQMMDDIDGEIRHEHFMLHYNFPPYSVGETGRLGTGRREVGHGHLAKRAIQRVLPSKDDFPYTIRVVSEILESNGSSSMASVCSGSLALLQAGIPIARPVAGIAMGLVSDGDNMVILSDILGEEDHLGDMDFKVAGTRNGITAFQMDIKIAGVDSDILSKAMEQARIGRLAILDIMDQTISSPEKSISEYAPKILTMKIDPDKLGTVIGPSGKTVKKISETNEVEVNIENDGTITIYGKNSEQAYNAQKMVEDLVEEPEVGTIYEGTVKRIMDFGAFVEILPGKEGLCHISKLAKHHVNKVRDVVNEGDTLKVKLIEIDKMGRYNLSHVDAIDSDASKSGKPSGKPSEKQKTDDKKGQRHNPSNRRRGS